MALDWKTGNKMPRFSLSSIVPFFFSIILHGYDDTGKNVVIYSSSKDEAIEIAKKQKVFVNSIDSPLDRLSKFARTLSKYLIVVIPIIFITLVMRNISWPHEEKTENQITNSERIKSVPVESRKYKQQTYQQEPVNVYYRDVAAIKRAVLNDTINPPSAIFCPKFEVITNKRGNRVYVGWYRSKDLLGRYGKDNIIVEVDNDGRILHIQIGTF